MGVMSSLALLRVHVLVVELPGRPVLRLRAEAAVRDRGWIVTREPADTDVLLVCGTPRAAIADAVHALWSDVPSPRARRTVRAVADLGEVLDSAARVLEDRVLQRRAAAEAAPAPAGPPPGRFGPLLPDWPAGLVLDCAPGADGRIAAVGARRLAAEPEDDALPAAVLAVADAARLLRLAGWAAPALRLDRVVDLSVAGVAPERLRPRLRSVAGRARGSGTLRTVLRDAAPSVDVHARLLSLLDAAIDDDAPPPPASRVLIGTAPDAVPLLVAATEPGRG
ncbi:MAG: hypothetical protein HIU86_07505 [Acidobacteria bacterium]|nr:hypothetical protein [Acidobacteriota bacterium]